MKVLYKFRSNIPDKQGIRRDTQSLIASQIYASPYNDLNDPFEGTVKLPLSRECDYWVTPLIQDLSSAGVYSLSKQTDGEEFPANEIMWSLYADGHKGFCIEYDSEVLLNCTIHGFDIRNTITVNYNEQSPEVSKADGIFSIQKKVFGTKSRSWISENEFRLVFYTSGLKTIPTEAIKGVYLGLRIGYEERNSILHSMTEKKIPVYQMIRNRESYSIRPVRVDVKSNVEILSQKEKPVKSFNVLWHSENIDRWSLQDFTNAFKQKHGVCNLSIFDDLNVMSSIDKLSSECSEKESDLIRNHWIGYSSFDSGTECWYYPEMWTL